MSKQYKACAIFWAPSRGGDQYLKNLGTLRDLLSEGWRVTRVDCLPTGTKSGTSDTTLMYILEKSDDEPETIHSSEQLDHERREAWQRGYTAGWKDRDCDFPPHTSENPYKGRELLKKTIERMILKWHEDGITLDEIARLVPQVPKAEIAAIIHRHDKETIKIEKEGE